MIVRYKPDTNKLTKATEFSACYDVSARIKVDDLIHGFTPQNKKMVREGRKSCNINAPDESFIHIGPYERFLIPTGIFLDFSDRIFDAKRYHVKIYPRSGIATKMGMCLANCTGIIDADYSNELFVPLINMSNSGFVLTDGMRIAQLEVVRNDYNTFTESNVPFTQESLAPLTTRKGGFGSTGE